MTTDSSTPTDAVVIERTFDAPTQLVWQMWTGPEHFKTWYGPTGARIPAAEMDVQVGGRRMICMEVGAEGQRMWFTGEYLEVVEPQRLVYTESMSDEHGNVLHRRTWACRKDTRPRHRSRWDWRISVAGRTSP